MCVGGHLGHGRETIQDRGPARMAADDARSASIIRQPCYRKKCGAKKESDVAAGLNQSASSPISPSIPSGNAALIPGRKRSQNRATRAVRS